MKILIFSKHFWPENFRINDIADDLVNRGHEVTIISTHPHYPNKKLFKDYKDSYLKNKKLNILRVPIIDFGGDSKISLVINYLSYIINTFILAPFFLPFKKFDIIFVFGTSPLIQGLSAIHLKYLYRSKLITWVLDLWPDDLESTGYVNNRFILSINKFLSKILYFFSDKILIQSNAFKKPINQILNNNKTVYFPNPVDRFLFDSLDVKTLYNKFNYSALNLNITYAGNIGNNQSIETIITVIKNLEFEKNIKFHIFGTGNKEKYLKSKLSKFDNVIFYGLKKIMDMKYVFHYSDCFLLTLSDFKNLNNTVPGRVHTFLATGKPIIASCNGESARIIKKSKGGLVTPAEDAALLKENIIFLNKMSKEKRNSIGEMGKKFALQNYHPDQLIVKLENIFIS